MTVRQGKKPLIGSQATALPRNLVDGSVESMGATIWLEDNPKTEVETEVEIEDETQEVCIPSKWMCQKSIQITRYIGKDINPGLVRDNHDDGDINPGLVRHQEVADIDTQGKFLNR